MTEAQPPKDFREEVLLTAKQFKTNWFDFGKILTHVATNKLYTVWGFPTFEDYCQHEIRIRKNTAMKLTNAFFFVEKEEPGYGDSMEKMPALDAINVLMKAKANENCSSEDYQDLHRSAFEKNLSGNTLAKKYRKLSKTDKEEVVTESDLFSQNLTLVRQLMVKICLLEEVPESFEQYLDEMEDFFREKTDQD